MLGKIKSQKTQMWLSIVVFVILFIALPLTLYEVKQQQTVNQHAAWFAPQEQHYACGPYLTVLLDIYKEIPDCSGSSGYVRDGSLKSFQSAVIIKAASGGTGAYTVHWKWDSFWCPVEDPHIPCLQNRTTTHEHLAGLTGSGPGSITAPLYSRADTAVGQFAGQACGYFQNDFGFYVTSNDNPNKVLCGVSLSDLGGTNNNASWCHTGVSCVVSPTPTTPVTPPITPTPTPSDTPTPTPTTTPSPTGTPTPTPTPGTTTPTPTTPVISATPTPIPVTPKPSLPSTGPGNTIVGIGLAGVAAAVVGAIVILAF